jgi:hypothetical protein
MLACAAHPRLLHDPEAEKFLHELQSFITRRTKLSFLSLTSLVPLPDDLPRQLAPQTDLDKLALMVPGVLSPR